MSYNVTQGFDLGDNATPPGIKSIMVGQAKITSVTVDGSTNEITAFVMDGDDNAWHTFECALGEGTLTREKTAGSGGLENVTSLTYRYGGLGQDKLDSLDDLVKSSKLPIVIELRNDDLYYVSRNGMTANTSSLDLGVSGAGAAAIGQTVVFTGHDVYDIQKVDLGSNADLDAITT